MSKMLKALQRLEEAGKADEPSESGTSAANDARVTQVSTPSAETSAGEPAPVDDTVTQARQMQQPSPGDYVPTPPASFTQPMAPANLQPQASSTYPPAPAREERNAAFTQPMGGQPAFNPYQDPAPVKADPHPLEGLGNTLLRSFEAEQAATAAAPDDQPQQDLGQTVPSVRKKSVEAEASSDAEVPGVVQTANGAGKEIPTKEAEALSSQSKDNNTVATLEDRLDRLRESAGQLYDTDAGGSSTSQTSVFSVNPYQPNSSVPDETHLSGDFEPDTDGVASFDETFIDIASDEDQLDEWPDASPESHPTDAPGTATPDNHSLAPELETEGADTSQPTGEVDAGRSTVFYGPPSSETPETSPYDDGRTISDLISPKAEARQSSGRAIVKPQEVLSHIEPEAGNTSQPYGATLSVMDDVVEGHDGKSPPDAVRRSSPLHRLTSAPAGEGEKVLLQRLEDATVAAQFSEMVVNLQRSFPAGVAASVLMLSEYEQSETSYVASAFALAAARELGEPVLLVDGNPGQAKVSQWFEASQQNGFVECLNGSEWQSLVTPTSVAGLHLLPAGQGMITSYENAPEQFCGSMTQLLQAYRFVIVDGGHLVEPLATTMAAHASATMLVVELGRSQADNVTAAVDTLHHNGARVLGAVAINAPPYH